MSCDVITSPRQKSMRLSDLPQYSVGAWTLSRQHLSLLRSSNPPIFGKPPRPDYWVDLAQIWCVGRSLSLGSLHGVLEGGGQHGYRVGDASLTHHATALPGLVIALVS